MFGNKSERREKHERIRTRGPDPDSTTQPIRTQKINFFPEYKYYDTTGFTNINFVACFREEKKRNKTLQQNFGFIPILVR